MPIPPRVARFRERMRAEHLRPGYSGRRHAWLSCGVMALGVGLCAALLSDISAAELWTLPVIFLVANLSEYLAHRYPMHRKVKPLEGMCVQHVAIHHRYFPKDAYLGEGPEDVFVTLLSPRATVFFVVGMMAPLGALATVIFGPNVGLLTVATGLAYMLVFQVLHLAYHAPDRSLLRRIPLIDRLSAHHRVHHDQALMGRYNFNISFPIFDAIFGTTWHPEATQAAPSHETSPHSQQA